MMTRNEIDKDLKGISALGNYPEDTCGCAVCRLMRHVKYLLSECERLEAKVKGLEEGVENAIHLQRLN